MELGVAEMIALAEGAVKCVGKSGYIHWTDQDRFGVLLKMIGEKMGGLGRIILEVEKALDK